MQYISLILFPEFFLTLGTLTVLLISVFLQKNAYKFSYSFSIFLLILVFFLVYFEDSYGYLNYNLFFFK